MTSSCSSAQNGQPPQSLWNTVAPYVVPPAAAAAAMVPCFRGLVAKSAIQCGTQPAPMSVTAGLVAGVRAVPTVARAVGAGLVVEELTQSALETHVHNRAVRTFVSAGAAAVTTAPLLAVLQGRSRGLSAAESIRRLTKEQWGALVVRELCFLGGQSGAAPARDSMRADFGDHPVVEHVGNALSGAAGSLAGHAADTAFTRWQEGLTVPNFRTAMLAVRTRTVTVAAFSTLYQWVKNKVMPQQPPQV